MAGSDFLNNLKKAVDTGEFNSDAAKKINEVDELATKKFGVNFSSEEELSALNEKIIETAKADGVKTVSKEEVAEINSKYDKEMELIRQKDAANKFLANLIDIEDTVMACVIDMFSYVNELDDNLKDKWDNPIYTSLKLKVDEIKSKYSSIINN
jgi:hypothetical protein